MTVGVALDTGGIMGGERYASETSKHREVLAPFCVGNGLDIGTGGDPIIPSAITLDVGGPDMANCGDHPLNLTGDARDLKWFTDGALDYVYSSHCLEDFDNTAVVLREWLRVVRKGGLIVLVLPDQQKYLAYCRAHDEPDNPGHKHEHFSMNYMTSVIGRIGGMRIVHKREVDPYGFEMVLEKI